MYGTHWCVSSCQKKTKYRQRFSMKCPTTHVVSMDSGLRDVLSMDPRDIRKEIPCARKSTGVTNRHQMQRIRKVLSQFTLPPRKRWSGAPVEETFSPVRECQQEESDDSNEDRQMDMTFSVDMEEESGDPDELLKAEAMKKIRIAPLKKICTGPMTTQQKTETDPREFHKNEEIDNAKEDEEDPDMKDCDPEGHSTGNIKMEDDLVETQVKVEIRGTTSELWARLERVVEDLVSKQVRLHFTQLEERFKGLDEKMRTIERATAHQIHKLTRHLQITEEDYISKKASMLEASAATEPTPLGCATPPTPVQGPGCVAAVKSEAESSAHPPESGALPFSPCGDVKSPELSDGLAAQQNSCQPSSNGPLSSCPVPPHIPVDTPPKSCATQVRPALQSSMAAPVLGPASGIGFVNHVGHRLPQPARQIPRAPQTIQNISSASTVTQASQISIAQVLFQSTTQLPDTLPHPGFAATTGPLLKASLHYLTTAPYTRGVTSSASAESLMYPPYPLRLPENKGDSKSGGDSGEGDVAFSSRLPSASLYKPLGL